MATPSQKSDFISRARQATQALLRARETIAGLIEVNNQTGLSGTLVDADFSGDNAGITAADFATAAATLVTFNSNLTTGTPPNTNLAKLLKIS